MNGFFGSTNGKETVESEVMNLLYNEVLFDIQDGKVVIHADFFRITICSRTVGF